MEEETRTREHEEEAMRWRDSERGWFDGLERHETLICQGEDLSVNGQIVRTA